MFLGTKHAHELFVHAFHTTEQSTPITFKSQEIKLKHLSSTVRANIAQNITDTETEWILIILFPGCLYKNNTCHVRV